MTPGRTAVLLIVLYVAAVWVRFHDPGAPRYPYYTGESATHYRVAAGVAEYGHVPPLDQRAWWPNGYEPLRTGPLGVEYVAGQSFRAFSKFSDMSQRRFTDLFTALVFSLSVFACFRLARAVWSCTAAGFMAAFLAAFFLPLLVVSDGRAFVHAPFAATIVAFIAAVTMGWVRKPSALLALVDAALVLMLLACWEHAGEAAAALALVLLHVRGDEQQRRRALILTAAAVLAGGILLPHLRAERFLLRWPALVVFASVAYAFAGRRLPARVPAAVWTGGAGVVLALVIGPVASGGATTVASLAGCWATRLRFLFGKPEDPTLLGDLARTLWQYPTSAPGLYGLINFFLPLVFLVPTTIFGIRAFRRSGGRSWPIALIAGAVGVAAFLVDRSAVFAASLSVIPLVSVSGFGFRAQWLRRIVFVAVALVLVGIAALEGSSMRNPISRLTTALGVSEEAEEGFLWISLGNADQELVRYLVSRTSVGDLFLAPPRVAPLMVQFGGRKLVTVPGIETAEAASRLVEYTHLFYGDEDAMYERCRALGITHVVYSIDVMLDLSRNSPRYLAGVGNLSRDSVARDMHFKPQRLTHFTLAYENDNYRVFRVTEKPEPFFLTDHPPVYQESIVERYGETLDKFYKRIVDVMLVYATARSAQDRGNDRDAIRRLRYCVEQIPEFTDAWTGIGDSMLRRGDLEAARAAYNRALRLAPDNAQALYFGAVASARLGDKEQALRTLDVLLNSTNDRYLLQQGRELQRFLQGGGKLEDSGPAMEPEKVPDESGE